MDWSSSVEHDSSPPGTDHDAGIPRDDIAVALQNQSLTLISLLAMHPRPHLTLRRFRDLVDAWRQHPTEQSLVAALRAKPGRFAMNIDQVMQALIPANDAPTQSMRAQPRGTHDVWRAADSCQHMHDLFVMSLLATHTTPDLVSGQFRTLLERLGKTPVSTTLDATALVAVRRSAMRFDRIVQLVTSARDGDQAPGATNGELPARPARLPRGQTDRFLQG
jgi:hypothetical protein